MATYMVEYMKIGFLELAIRKTSDYYLKLPWEQTPIAPHFSWIFLTDSQIKKILNFLKTSLKVVVTTMR